MVAFTLPLFDAVAWLFIVMVLLEVAALLALVAEATVSLSEVALFLNTELRPTDALLSLFILDANAKFLVIDTLLDLVVKGRAEPLLEAS